MEKRLRQNMYATHNTILAPAAQITKVGWQTKSAQVQGSALPLVPAPLLALFRLIPTGCTSGCSVSSGISKPGVASTGIQPSHQNKPLPRSVHLSW